VNLISNRDIFEIKKVEKFKTYLRIVAKYESKLKVLPRFLLRLEVI